MVAPDLIASPKSYKMVPGMTVSKSTKHNPSFVSQSNIMLFNLVSLCVTFIGINFCSIKEVMTGVKSFRCKTNCISSSQSLARSQGFSFKTFKKVWKR